LRAGDPNVAGLVARPEIWEWSGYPGHARPPDVAAPDRGGRASSRVGGRTPTASAGRIDDRIRQPLGWPGPSGSDFSHARTHFWRPIMALSALDT
jgi:hypothetical protein